MYLSDPRRKSSNHTSFKFLIGIDEVGRGPIAGPVAVGAFIFLTPTAERLFDGVKESKQLSEKKREEWCEKILEIKKAGHVDFSVSFQNEKVIDEQGISYAIRHCLENSIENLNMEADECRVLLDGGLKAPLKYADQETIIKGDAKESVIALASICAKVERDRLMRKLALEYPEYGFDVHKGYGTARHYEAIARHGLCPIHRRTFIK